MIKISKVCLDIDGKRIELTMKQAKKLNEVLNDTFGSTEVVFRDRWYRDPYTQPYLGQTTTTATPYPFNSSSSGSFQADAANLTDVPTITSNRISFSDAEWGGVLEAGTLSLSTQ